MSSRRPLLVVNRCLDGVQSLAKVDGQGLANAFVDHADAQQVGDMDLVYVAQTRELHAQQCGQIQNPEAFGIADGFAYGWRWMGIKWPHLLPCPDEVNAGLAA